MFVDTDLNTWGESVGWDSTKVNEDELTATKEINAEVASSYDDIIKSTD